MSLLFEEIDSQPTPIGEITLRRRRIPAIGDEDIYEVKLGEEFLMSSLFVDAEVALADLGLAATTGSDLQVVVGGLGLGYTAVAALRNERVGALWVVEALEAVIGWHRGEKVPLGKTLNADERCHYVHGSFFDLAVDGERGFVSDQPGKRFDAILLDIDHSPSALLNAANASFYTVESLQCMAEQLTKDGVFALWSNELPDPDFVSVLESVFQHVDTEVVEFFNTFQNAMASNSVYIARAPR